jgi:hypothetical protein
MALDVGVCDAGICAMPTRGTISRCNSAWTSIPMRRISQYTLSNDIRDAVLVTFLQQDPFEERILVSQHGAFIAFIHTTPMGSFGFIDSNGFLKLFNVLCPTFSVSSLGLTIAFFALLGSICL